MRLHHRRAVILISMFALSAPGFTSDLALIHAKIYASPTNSPVKNRTILIHNGRITGVGPSGTTRKLPHFARAVTVIDCTGLVVTAGFWNSHVHILTQGLLNAERLSADQLSSSPASIVAAITCEAIALLLSGRLKRSLKD